MLATIVYCLDYIKSMASIDICRQIVFTLEREKTSLGRLSHANFKVGQTEVDLYKASHLNF